MNIKNLILFLVLISQAGCASVGSSRMDNDTTNKTCLHGLSDEESIKIFDEVYGQKVDTPIDRIAKEITITAFIRAMKASRSVKIDESGVLGRKYEEVDLKKWDGEDLVNFSQDLEREIREENRTKQGASRNIEGNRYWGYSSGTDRRDETEDNGSGEEISTLDVIRLTAVYSIEKEIQRRNNISGVLTVVGDSLGKAVTVTARVAGLLAGFMI
ncbi:MAG: hypothetical protein ABH883_09760 [Candidatus Omnitrophota bacterium]